MLIVTNRPSVYVTIDGATVELEVDKPTEVDEAQGVKLVHRGICLAVLDEPKSEAEVEAEAKKTKKAKK